MGRRQTEGRRQLGRQAENFGMRRKGAKKGETAMRPMAENGKASDIHALLRHLVILGLAQSKPSGPAKACTGHAQAELDGAPVRVYPVPKPLLSA